MGKDFLTILDKDSTELKKLINLAITLKSERANGMRRSNLQNKCVGLIFEKSSTRTRVSFEVGVYELGGYPLFLSASDIQLGRGEPVKDTARVLSRYLNAIMIRTYGHDRAEELAEYADIPVINGLTDDYHPCQVLADVMTFYEEFNRYEGIKVAYVGDGNNMAHSWLNAAARFGFELAMANPAGCEVNQVILNRAISEAEKSGAKITVTDDVKSAVAGADVVTTDVWASMGQEAHAEQKAALLKPFQINSDIMKLTNEKAIFLHCLPAHRGEEVTADVFESPASRVFDEAENRLHVQKAIMIDLIL